MELQKLKFRYRIFVLTPAIVGSLVSYKPGMFLTESIANLFKVDMDAPLISDPYGLALFVIMMIIFITGFFVGYIIVSLFLSILNRYKLDEAKNIFWNTKYPSKWYI